jgi:hypothetical protein
MHIYIISILLYFILTFAALWIIDIKNGENTADKKMKEDVVV